MITPRLRLPDVTLVAIDTACHKLTAMALQECMDRVDFGGVLVLADKLYDQSWLDRLVERESVRWHAIKPCNVQGIGDHTWYTLPPLIKTSHYLIVQWDSWVLNAAAWTDEFLAFDYIGAPWGWHRDQYEVGNGGFSLRSRKLGQYLAGTADIYPFAHPEDDTLCRRYRPMLEQYANFRWAPEALAERFSFERTPLQEGVRSFGFHGVFNFPRVLPPAAVRERLRYAPAYVLDNPEVQGILRELVVA